MAQDKQDKKGTLINELDSLRHTLNSGPEFQQDIPILNEQHASSISASETTPQSTQGTDPLEQCDLFRDSDGLIHDPDLDVPILTDAYEEQEASVTSESPSNISHTEAISNTELFSSERPNSEQSNSELSNTEPSNTELTAPETSNDPEQLNTTDSTDIEVAQPETQQNEPEASIDKTSIDIEKLSNETDSSVMELEQVIDELVAEQLPKLEQQLREKLRSELEADVETKIEPEK